MSQVIENKIFDSVIMLTWSNWFNELRSNRYHYARRFANCFLVLFVQPDLDEEEYRFENTEIPNVIVLHVYKIYGHKQVQLLNEAICKSGIKKPLLWIYNFYFHKFIGQYNSILNVYHGTEDYLASESPLQLKDRSLTEQFNKTLSYCELLICVSEGVADSFKTHSSYNGEIIIITNGCDYNFLKPNFEAKENDTPVIFYQGNIFDKIDYELLIALAKKQPTWEFVFCGRVIFNEDLWKVLISMPNVKYLGLLTAEQVRDEAYKADVGIIPFKETEWLVGRSFPLKCFEYLACGLPVVSVPISALRSFKNVIEFASGVDEFEKAVQNSMLLRHDKAHLELRLGEAAKQNYDIKFEEVFNAIIKLSAKLLLKRSKRNFSVGIVYEIGNEIFVSDANKLIPLVSLSTNSLFFIPSSELFKYSEELDAVIIPIFNYKNSKNFTDQFINIIKQYGCLKILWTTIELKESELIDLVEKLGIHHIFLIDKSGIFDLNDRHLFLQSLKIPIENIPLISHDLRIGKYSTPADKFDDFLNLHIRSRNLQDKKDYLLIYYDDEGALDLNYDLLVYNPSKKLIESKSSFYNNININISYANLIHMFIIALRKDFIQISYSIYRKFPENFKKFVRVLVPKKIKKYFLAFN